MPETPGGRLYQIRLACGDGVRTPETLSAFSDRVFALTGERYYSSGLSNLERDIQQWRLRDVENFARVDPQQRGPVWLATWDDWAAANEKAPRRVPMGPVGTPVSSKSAAAKKSGKQAG